MRQHPSSEFPFDQATVLSDPRLESRLSSYLTRLEFTIGEMQDLLEQQSRSPDLVRSAARRRSACG